MRRGRGVSAPARKKNWDDDVRHRISALHEAAEAAYYDEGDEVDAMDTEEQEDDYDAYPGAENY